MPINTSDVEIAFQSKHGQLEAEYLDITSRIDQAESESLLLAESAMTKSSVRGPRQTDESYAKALKTATDRYTKITTKIATVFSGLRDTVHEDRVKKQARIERSYISLTQKSERDSVSHDRRSVTYATGIFNSSVTAISMSEG